MTSIVNFLTGSLSLYLDPVLSRIWKKSDGIGFREVTPADLNNFKRNGNKGPFFNGVTGEFCLGSPKEPNHIKGGFKVYKLAQYIFGSTFWLGLSAVSQNLLGYPRDTIKWIKIGAAIGSVIGAFKSYEKDKKVIFVFKGMFMPRFL